MYDSNIISASIFSELRSCALFLDLRTKLRYFGLVLAYLCLSSAFTQYRCASFIHSFIHVIVVASLVRC